MKLITLIWWLYPFIKLSINLHPKTLTGEIINLKTCRGGSWAHISNGGKVINNYIPIMMGRSVSPASLMSFPRSVCRAAIMKQRFHSGLDALQQLCWLESCGEVHVKSSAPTKCIQDRLFLKKNWSSGGWVWCRLKQSHVASVTLIFRVRALHKKTKAKRFAMSQGSLLAKSLVLSSKEPTNLLWVPKVFVIPSHLNKLTLGWYAHKDIWKLKYVSGGLASRSKSGSEMPGHVSVAFIHYGLVSPFKNL